MIHRFRLTTFGSDSREYTDWYECDDSERLWGNCFSCVILDGPRAGQKVCIHNDMIVQTITNAHARQDAGMSRPGCYCGYCHRKRIIEQMDGRRRYHR